MRFLENEIQILRNRLNTIERKLFVNKAKNDDFKSQLIDLTLAKWEKKNAKIKKKDKKKKIFKRFSNSKKTRDDKEEKFDFDSTRAKKSKEKRRWLYDEYEKWRSRLERWRRDFVNWLLALNVVECFRQWEKRLIFRFDESSIFEHQFHCFFLLAF